MCMQCICLWSFLLPLFCPQPPLLLSPSALTWHERGQLGLEKPSSPSGGLYQMALLAHFGIAPLHPLLLRSSYTAAATECLCYFSIPFRQLLSFQFAIALWTDCLSRVPMCYLSQEEYVLCPLLLMSKPISGEMKGISHSESARF